ncbi:MAG: toll/interleukin-1 receptor domain-containing protein [Methylococcales bacterium]
MSSIPAEEWSLLANALAEPIKQLIAVETTDSTQMREVELRLLELAGTRTVLRQKVEASRERPEAVWRRARELTNAPMSDLPLLLVTVDTVPQNPEQRQSLAQFWRGMNQLRENWGALPAQVLFLLSPTAYEHLTLNADHLKSWISLKIQLFPGIEELAVQAASNTPPVQDEIPTETSQYDEIRSRQLKILGRQAETALHRTENPSSLVRQYYLPLISGYLAMGALAKAKTWRAKTKPTWSLEERESRKLGRIEEQMAAWTRKPFEVYLSHYPQDKIAELVIALEAYNLTIWPDRNEILSEVDRFREIEAELQTSSALALCFGPAGIGPWEDEEMRAVLKRAVLAKKPVIPVLLPGAHRLPKWPEFLGNRNWVDFRQGYTQEGLDRLVWGITRPPVEPNIEAFLAECRKNLGFEATDKGICLDEFEKLFKLPHTTDNKKNQIKILLEHWLDAGITESQSGHFVIFISAILERIASERIHFPFDGVIVCAYFIWVAGPCPP